jgi:WD40 repeat protein
VSSLAPGASVGGYRIVRLLGRGGMGAVYEATAADGARVAIKFMLEANDPVFLERFRRESRAATRVSHPNIARVLGAGELERAPYLVLEFLPGGTLDDRLKKSGRVPWPEAAALGARIARGLLAIHEAGLVHRDMKPANVLLDAEGRPRVADFGLARSVGQGSIALTKTGEMVGTLEFMAPEQAEGGTAVDARADLYALGGTLFALLTGEPPFEGSGITLITKHVRERPRAVRTLAPGVPERFERLVAKLLAKHPQERGTDAEAIAELEAIATAPTSSRRGLALAGGVVALAAGAVALGLAARGPAGSPAAPSPSPAPSPSSAKPVRKTPSPSPSAAAPRTLDQAPARDIDATQKTADERILGRIKLRGAIEYAAWLQVSETAGHRESPALAEYAGGAWTLSADEDGEVILWDGGEKLARALASPARIPIRAIATIAIGENGGRAITVDYGGEGVCWTIEKGDSPALRVRSRFSVHAAEPTGARFLTEGVALVAGRWGTSRVDFEAGSVTSLGDPEPVTTLARGFATSVLAGHPSGAITAWTLAEDGLTKSSLLPKGKSGVKSIHYDPKGGKILVLDDARTFRVQSATTGEVDSENTIDWDACSAVFGAGENEVLTPDIEEGPVLWRRTGKDWKRAAPREEGPAVLHRPARSFVSSETYGRLLTTAHDGTVRPYTISPGAAAAVAQKPLLGTNRVIGHACEARAPGAPPWLAVAQRGPDADRVVSRFTLGDSTPVPRHCPSAATCVAINRTGEIAAGTQDNRCRVWRFDGQGELNEPFAELIGPATWSHQIAFADDGVRIVTACGDGLLRIFDAGETVPPDARNNHYNVSAVERLVIALALGKDGRPGAATESAVTLAQDGAVQWWVLAPKALQPEGPPRPGTGEWATALAIDRESRSAKSVLVALGTRIIQVPRDAAAPPVTIVPKTPPLRELAWYGSRLVGVCRDATVRVWKLDGEEVARLDYSKAADNAAPSALVFQPGGKWLFVGTDTGALDKFELKDEAPR